MAAALRKVLIINKTYPAAGLELLNNNGLKTTVLPCLDSYPNVKQKIMESLAEGYDAIIWNTKFVLTEDKLELAGPQLKAISTMSAGLDHVDLAAVKKRGIPLGSIPHVQDNCVAEHALGLLIAAARRYKEGLQMVGGGEWKPGVNWVLGQDIAGSTVGVVGFGGIGQAIVRRLKAFEVARFYYTGRSDKPEANALGASRVPLEQMLKESDYVLLCCPLTAETKNLIDAAALRLMKSNAILINVARGELVDHDALTTALKEKWIFAAALDVTAPEPLPKDHPLVDLPNCYIVPHFGSSTFETRNDMARVAANNVIAALAGKPMPFPVNIELLL